MALLGGSQGLAGGNATPQQNCVLMFYGMNGDMMNCERLFNLVCVYGNIVRIKFLKSKDGAAMVQVYNELVLAAGGDLCLSGCFW